jgi:hypothetical protein
MLIVQTAWITAVLIAGCVATSAGTDIVKRLPLEVAWTPSPTLEIDADCDGRNDEVFIGRDATRYYVAAVLAPVTPNSTATYVSFLLSGDSQDSFCGEPEPLEAESLDFDIIESLGEVPEGWSRSPTCKGLQLTAGECDRFHLYWNRTAKRLDWWRL